METSTPAAPPGRHVGLIDALKRLHGTITRAGFNLSGPAEEDRRAGRDRVARDIAGLIARLRDLHAPLLVVFGGVTGAGKSTMVNTLVGEVVATTGVVRPTTAVPTLLAHPGDMGWFDDDRVLPELARVHGAARKVQGAEGPGLLRLVPNTALAPGLALVDAPDIDSVRDTNRRLAEQLLDAADLWLWFTTGGKYADEDSMRYLRRAQERRTALSVALTRLEPRDADEITADFSEKLAAEGIHPDRILVIPETTVQDERLPAPAAAELRDWLWTMAQPEERRRHRRRTLDGALAALPAEVDALAGAVEGERVTARMLSQTAERAAETAQREFARALDEGLPLRREILGRWNAFVGTGRLLRLAEEAGGQARRWVGGLLAHLGGPEQQRVQREMRIEVADTVSRLVVQVADLAAADTAHDWARSAAGRALLAAHPELERSAPDLPVRVERTVLGWQETVVELVETQGAERRSRARWMSTAVNAVATAAIVLALASTGGFTGAEAGIATAAGAANQTLLVKLLGAQNLRWLVSRAREDLQERVGVLAGEEQHRFTAVVDDAAPPPELVDDLRAATQAVAAARDADGA